MQCIPNSLHATTLYRFDPPGVGGGLTPPPLSVLLLPQEASSKEQKSAEIRVYAFMSPPWLIRSRKFLADPTRQAVD